MLKLTMHKKLRQTYSSKKNLLLSSQIPNKCLYFNFILSTKQPEPRNKSWENFIFISPGAPPHLVPAKVRINSAPYCKTARPNKFSSNIVRCAQPTQYSRRNPLNPERHHKTRHRHLVRSLVSPASFCICAYVYIPTYVHTYIHIRIYPSSPHARRSRRRRRRRGRNGERMGKREARASEPGQW